MFPLHKSVTLTALLLMNLLAGCQHQVDPSPLQSGDYYHTARPKPTDTAANLIKLEWRLVDTMPIVSQLSAPPTGATLIAEKKLDDFGGVKVSVYTMASDEDYVYARTSTSKGQYSLGAIGTYNYRQPEDIKVEVVRLFSEKVLKITGGLGANNSLSNYYLIDESGNPSGLLQIDTGHSKELDVDQDGSFEGVAAHGSPMSAYIYRWNIDHAEVTYVNDALKADSVVLTDEGIYEASNIGDKQSRRFRLTVEGLISER
ncbi:hypothetical protein [Paenibacillus odorifer]|uniref:hypothetical protein n=1 Tax=Paenibacillus TaxID=44249 RepID=UPI00096DA77B|nr:hypothetical protein [Paenibacillus odorifer]OME21918.1 hypothetical protein BSK57_19040 [Paenibacillus odorifer]OME29616.1 hypothetical protein BSK63_20630 [Paenibacillus odorifer]OME31853.1 hypothetical protein BSK46_24930 [Paenibacillus odorifer]